MISKIFGALGVARRVVALVILTGATTGLVASSLDVNASRVAAASAAETRAYTNAAELDVLTRMCLEMRDANSDVCAQAIEKSGLTASEFWSKLAISLNEQVRRQEQQKKDEATSATPKPQQNTVDTSALLGLVNACVASHERSSEYCAKAVAASGLSADEFWAKVSALFNKPSETPKPTESPKTSETPKTEGLSVIIGNCLAKFEAAKNGTYSEPLSTSDACRKAFEATGLTPEQFYAKFVQKPTTTEKPATAPRSGDEIYTLIKDCQAAYERARAGKETSTVVGQICQKAIEASGLSANDFWAKYYPKPAATPTATSRPTPTPTARPQSVSDAQLQVLVQDCFTKYTAATAGKDNEDLGRAAYEACTKAITASGLSGDAFFAKFGKPPVATH